MPRIAGAGAKKRESKAKQKREPSSHTDSENTSEKNNVKVAASVNPNN